MAILAAAESLQTLGRQYELCSRKYEVDAQREHAERAFQAAREAAAGALTGLRGAYARLSDEGDFLCGTEATSAVGVALRAARTAAAKLAFTRLPEGQRLAIKALVPDRVKTIETAHLAVAGVAGDLERTSRASLSALAKLFMVFVPLDEPLAAYCAADRRLSEMQAGQPQEPDSFRRLQEEVSRRRMAFDLVRARVVTSQPYHMAHLHCTRHDAAFMEVVARRQALADAATRVELEALLAARAAAGSDEAFYQALQRGRAASGVLVAPDASRDAPPVAGAPAAMPLALASAAAPLAAPAPAPANEAAVLKRPGASDSPPSEIDTPREVVVVGPSAVSGAAPAAHPELVAAARAPTAMSLVPAAAASAALPAVAPLALPAPAEAGRLPRPLLDAWDSATRVVSNLLGGASTPA